jgi:acetylornithine deacetylase
VSSGISGHAARNEGENAIYHAIPDIEWFKGFTFDKVSDMLGPLHMNVTMIQAGSQHNVVPDSCRFTVDVRTTDAYTLEETLDIIQANVKAEVTPRSVRLRPSSIPLDHPLVNAARKCNFKLFGSPTLSDQALMSFPTIKMGPGDSSRSHSADEFIFTEQLKQGLNDYRRLLDMLTDTLK